MSFVAIVVSCIVLFGQLVTGQGLFDLALWYQYGGAAVPPELNLHFAEFSLLAVTWRGWFLIGQNVDKPSFREAKLSDIPVNVLIALAVFSVFVLTGLIHVL